MRAVFYWSISNILQLAAILLLMSGVIAILYPVILIIGSLMAIVILILLITFPYKSSQRDRNIQEANSLKKNNRWIGSIKHFSATRRLLRTLIIALTAMIFSFSLMGLLKIHSWLFYIQPLSQELEPFRKIYIQSKDEFKPLQKSLIGSEKSLQEAK